MAQLSTGNTRPAYDKELTAITDYVLNYQPDSLLAYETAYYAFLDSLGCACLALQYPACTKLLGPIIPGTQVPDGVKIPGTAYQLDFVQAAFNIGILIRWLDFNDTWLAAEWGHPSDNLGGILAVADYLSRRGKKIRLKEIFTAMIKAYEIQGILALENSFNHAGLDHIVLVKIATAAVTAQLLGGDRQQILAALSNAWLDGHSLRTYRHAPNTGSRKSWAAGDATSRGVYLAWLALKGEMGYPSALTAPRWGFYDVLFKGAPFKFQRNYGSYVMENILFKISFPAEFHAQTAVEAAITLHPLVKNCLEAIDKIIITTHESAIRIISKTGALYNPADRDHCLQYMVAIGLLFGELTAGHYEDNVAADPRIDILRNKMLVEEDKGYSKDYLDSEKRSITNSLQIYFKDGSVTEKITVEYPLGHKRRRNEGIPLLLEKFKKNLSTAYTGEQLQSLFAIFFDKKYFETLPLDALMDQLANPQHQAHVF